MHVWKRLLLLLLLLQLNSRGASGADNDNHTEYVWWRESGTGHGFVGVGPASTGYALAVGPTASRVWLRGAGFAVRAFGAWHVHAQPQPQPPEAVCALVRNADFSAPNSTAHRTERTPGECCALCKATPGCRAFAWTPNAASDAAPLCELKSGGPLVGPRFRAGTTAGRVETPAPFLALEGRATREAYDALGWCDAFHVTATLETGDEDGGNASVDFSVRYCARFDVFVFETFFVDGVADTRTDVCFGDAVFRANWTVQSAAEEDPFCVTDATSTAFPVFSLAEGAPAHGNLESLTWYGPWAQLITGPEIDAFGSAGGPVALFDTTPEREINSSLVLGAFATYTDEHITTCDYVDGVPLSDCDLLAGASGYLTDIPRWSSFPFLLAFSRYGPITALRKYGLAIQMRSSQTLPPEAISDTIGFWSDERSFYGPNYWKDQPSVTLHDVLEDARDTMEASMQPIQYFHIGPFWAESDDGSSGACVGGSATPNAKVLGKNGVKGILDLLGKAVLHVPPFCENASVANSGWEISCRLRWESGELGRLGTASPHGAAEFWKQLLPAWFGPDSSESAIVLSKAAYQHGIFPSTLSVLGGYDTWLTSLTGVLSDRNMTLLLDMPMPSDFLEAATRSRVAGVVFSSPMSRGRSIVSEENSGSLLLASVLGLHAIPGSLLTTDGAFSPTQNAAAYAMLGGPLGVGDQTWRTDPSVLKALCRPDGKILRPLMFATPYLPSLYDSSVRYDPIWLSSSVIGTSDWSQYYQALVNGTEVKLESTALHPRPKDGVSFMAWATASPGCCDGCPASGCIFDPFATPHATQGYEMWQIFPVTPTGWALLGELDKYIAVSSTRFISIDQGAYSRIEATLVGVPGEQVNVIVLVPFPKATIRIVTQEVPESGLITISG